jgi:hypothetical protein
VAGRLQCRLLQVNRKFVVMQDPEGESRVPG